jgi:hypothetical protein
MMRKQYLRILITLIGAACSGMAARSQTFDRIVVKIPYEFVVAGKTLPAGTYVVDRLFKSSFNQMVISSFENRATAIVLPLEAVSNNATNARVSFQEVGGQFFLSKVETADHIFTIPISRSAIMEASAKSHSNAANSESAAGSH